jgi:uncharacterized protein YndB with AHSA1/START domain
MLLPALLAIFVSTPLQEPQPLPPVVHSAEVDATVDEVWDALTTSKGIVKWMVHKGEIDARIGGLMRSTYNPNGSIDDEGAIHNQILSIDPKRMLSFRCVKTPKTFPFKEAMEKMWTVIHVEPITPKRTRLTIRCHGFTTEESSAKMRGFFAQGNGSTIESLKKLFPDKSVAGLDPAMQELGKLVGGVWVSDVTKARLKFEWCMGGKAIRGNSRIGIGGASEAEALVMLTWDPAKKAVSYIDFHGSETVYQGTMMLKDGVMVYDFTTLVGGSGNYRFAEKFTSKDEMQVTLYQMKDGEWKSVFETVYKRLADS